MSKRSNWLRNEEVPVLASFLLKSLERDMAHFQALLLHVDQSYLDAFQTKIELAENMVDSRVKTGELKLITAKLYDSVKALRPYLDKIGLFAQLSADSLTVSSGSFGISKVREHINRGNVEGVLDSLKVLLQNVDTNKAALEAVGLTQTFIDEIVGLKDIIKDGNISQNLKMDERDFTSTNSTVIFNEVYQFVTDVTLAGKVLFKYTDKDRLSDYTIYKLKKRLRNDGSKLRIINLNAKVEEQTIQTPEKISNTPDHLSLTG